MAVFTSAVALGTAFLSTTVGAAIGQLVAGLALNLVAQELFGPDDPGQQRSGIVGTMQLGAEVPRSFICGRYATAGSLVYHNHWGHTSTNDGALLTNGNPLDPPTAEVNNDYYTRITALSDAPIHALSALILDDTYTQIDWANPDTELDRGYPLLQFTTSKEWTTFTVDNPTGGTPESGVITGSQTNTYQIVRGWVKFYDGTQTEADDFVVKMVSTDERPWGTDCVGKGVAYAIVTLRYDEELYKRLPEIKYVVDGISCFDPRDSAQKSGTRNPILMLREIINGISVSGQWLYGCQRPVALDDTELGAQATLCGLNPPGWDALTDPEKTAIWGHADPIGRYLAGAEITVDTPIAEALERIGLSCNAAFADAGSHLRILVGEDTSSTLPAITDADFRSTSEQGYDPFPPLAEAVNAITATFPSPADLWEVQDAPPLYDAALEAEDDNRRLVRNIDLVSVPWPEQVERLMKAAQAEARRGRSHTGVLPAVWWSAQPGDYIEWTSPRNGYSDKLFRVAGVIDLANGDVAVTLTEMDPDAYDWAPLTDYTTPSSAPPIKQALPPVKITGFDVKPSYQVDAVGDFRRPAILIQWVNPALPNVITGLQYQVRLAANQVIVVDGVAVDLEAEAHTIQGLLPGTAYEVRVRWRTARPSEWSAWTAVTTPDVRLGTADLADTVNTSITDAQDDATQALADAAAAQADHDALVDGFTGGTLQGALDTVEQSLSLENYLDAAALLPEDFTEDGRFWTDDLDVSPANATALQSAVTFTTSPTYGRLANIDASIAASVYLNTVGVAKMVPGRRYRIEVEARLAAADASGGPHLQTQFRALASDYSYVIHSGKSHSFDAANAFRVFSHELTIPSDGSWDGAAHVRFVTFKPNTYAVAGADILVRRITVQDITDADRLSGDIVDILGLNIGPTYAFGVMIQELQVDAGGNSAFVSDTAAAIADIEGNMSASYSLGVGAGGAGAGLLLFASDDLGGSPASGVAIRADQLTVSAGRNLLTNTDFSQGAAHWTIASTIPGGELTHGIRTAGSSWAGSTYPTYYIYQDGTGAGIVDLRQKPIMGGSQTSHGLPVAPGDWIELSAKLSHHRCGGAMYLLWYNSAGTYLGASGGELTGEAAGSQTNPNEWPTYWIKGQAPANAAYVQPAIRKLATSSGSDSYLFIHQPQMTFAHANQLEPTPYARGGVTMIDGSGIVAGSITAATGAIGDLAVGTLQIQDEAVTVPRYASNTTVVQFRNPNEEYDLVEVTVPKQTQRVRIRFHADIVGKEASGTFSGIELRFYKIQGGTRSELTVWRPFGLVNNLALPFPQVHEDNTSYTGDVTYGVEGNWAGDADVLRSFIEVDQFLK